MNKLFIFISIFLVSTSSFSGKLDDIQDSLDEIQNRQRINDAMNELELSRIRREKSNLVRQRDLDELSRLQMGINKESPVVPKSIRKYQNDVCVIPFNSTDTGKILKIVSFDDGNYTTHSFLKSTEGWIFKKDRVTFVEDFSKKDGVLINENYLITNCPKFDSVLNIKDYVKNLGKSK